jgi:hypothetical protein
MGVCIDIVTCTALKGHHILSRGEATAQLWVLVALMFRTLTPRFATPPEADHHGYNIVR